jgi:hypothetical protein
MAQLAAVFFILKSSTWGGGVGKNNFGSCPGWQKPPIFANRELVENFDRFRPKAFTEKGDCACG